MKKVYMVQPNSQYGNFIYFPYAAGVIAAYAFEDDFIKEHYSFEGFIYKRIETTEALSFLSEPSVVAFSCYAWNYEYNKSLAKIIKEKNPECITVFGGHQINPETSSELLSEKYADYLIFGEGEEIFRRLLISLNTSNQCEIPNIAFLKNNEIFYTETSEICVPQIVSPYDKGIFDDILKSEKELLFSAILETNRGCPNRCSFCDWGNIKSKVRLFDMETIKKDIDWMSDNKIEYCYCADANFGLFERDEDIIEYLIKNKIEKGFPFKFQTTFSKKNFETVFRINKRLNDVGMCKGATLSFQSMSADTLNNINRQNMPLSYFVELMTLYNKNHISAYSELILGLPGETYESFKEGIDQLLNSGQHMSIAVFNCELLINSEMGKKEYREKFKIETARVEQHQFHTKPNFSEIKEFSDIIVSTYSMSKEDWKRSNLYEVYVRCFHNLGLLQCFAIYLHNKTGMKYSDFYEAIISKSYDDPYSVCGEITKTLNKKFEEILDNKGALNIYDKTFGQITWPFEEWAFLFAIKNFDRLYSELDSFLENLVGKKIYKDLLSYQKAIIKTPYSKQITLNTAFDFYKYFSSVYNNQSGVVLEPKACTILISSKDTPEDIVDYAREVVWFGRKGGQNIITDVEYI